MKETVNIKKCMNCDKELNRSKKYCSHSCQKEYEHDVKKQKFLRGEDNSYDIRTIKKFLIEIKGYFCEVCDLSSWNDQHIVLEIDHIDGNSSNNKCENLRLICPNCHSQTKTYKNKNMGNGRHYRRERYANSQSY